MARSTASVLIACMGMVAATESHDRKITEVVKLLEELMDASKAEGESERKLYAKYKCYCDSNEEQKTAEIEKLTQEIEILAAKIEELRSDNSVLSTEVAGLKKDMADNRASKDEADALRSKENAAFLTTEADLEQAIEQMKNALKTLAEVGADQTMNTAQDHKQYMAGYKSSKAVLMKLQSSVNTALMAASSFVTPKQVEPVAAFLQAPFTGTYSARSGEVVGILKSMRDTFTANLADARATEANQADAHAKLVDALNANHEKMNESNSKKQESLGQNDGQLAANREQKSSAEATKAAAEDFLRELLPMCAEKAKQYQTRVDLRNQEEAAVAQAIAILNSDAAFATFGNVDATSGMPRGVTAFVQLRQRTVHKHKQLGVVSKDDVRRETAQGFLQKAEAVKDSTGILGRISMMLQAHNPFDTVVKEIAKMLSLIDKEGQADEEQKLWCISERKNTNDAIVAEENRLETCNGHITDLNRTISDPETGLQRQIALLEDELSDNRKSQTDLTADRTEENLVYQKDVATLQEATSLIQQAIKVLKNYYTEVAKTLEESSLAQMKDGPAPPSTWEGSYQGQTGAGSNVINMLTFILTNTQKEEQVAHSSEQDAQHSFEDNMQGLVTSMKRLMEVLAGLSEALARNEEELILKQTEKVQCTKELDAQRDYLQKIKPGCDFIMDHFVTRENARAQESDALRNVRATLQDSPVYQNAEKKAHLESLGDCVEFCDPAKGVQDNVECKACLAKVTIPGYCAGHPKTAGC